MSEDVPSEWREEGRVRGGYWELFRHDGAGRESNHPRRNRRPKCKGAGVGGRAKAQGGRDGGVVGRNTNESAGWGLWRP